MENGTQEMFEQLTLPIFQESTAGLSEPLAKISALPGEEQDLTEKEVALYEKFLESWKSSKKKINPHGLSTKTLRECFLATEDLISYQSSLKWTDSGTISSGKITTEDVFVVWFCKALQNSKALLSTNVPDGMYYEVAYNGDKNKCYLDAYKKWQNVCIEM